MDQATLVKDDRIIEAQVLEALDRARVPVTLCEWNYVPQLEEWQLIIATPCTIVRAPARPIEQQSTPSKRLASTSAYLCAACS